MTSVSQKNITENESSPQKKDQEDNTIQVFQEEELRKDENEDLLHNEASPLFQNQEPNQLTSQILQLPDNLFQHSHFESLEAGTKEADMAINNDFVENGEN